jgi:hypothetical protein
MIMPLVRGRYAVLNPAWLAAGQPAGLDRRNIDRFDADADLSALTTQVMLSVALPLQAGDTVTSLAFKSGATAAGTPTNWWVALYDPAGNLLSQSADQTSTAWTADTTKALPLATPQGIATAGVYYAAIMVKATTPPSLVGVTLGRAAVAAGFTAADRVLAQTSGSGLTTTAPATIASPTAVATVPLVGAS